MHKNKSFYHSNSSSEFGMERKMASICNLQAFYILSILEITPLANVNIITKCILGNILWIMLS
jgi:hypothetical protein